MSLVEEVSDRGLGWPLGIGLVVAAISAGPQIAKASRPLVKRAIKAYLVMHDKTKEMMAETGERMQDLYAEAKHEHEQEEMVSQGSVPEEKEAPAAAAEGEKPSRPRKAKQEESEEQ